MQPKSIMHCLAIGEYGCLLAKIEAGQPASEAAVLASAAVPTRKVGMSPAHNDESWMTAYQVSWS
jgi:hypothetical protein